MKQKTLSKNVLPIRGKSSVGGIILFLVAAAFMVYLIFPNTGAFFDRSVAKGTIESVSMNQLSVSYVNKHDHRTYYLSRKVDSRLEQYVKSHPTTIEVIYSKFFPENAVLPEVENDRSILSAVSILAIIATAFFVIKDDLMKHFL